MKRITFEKSPEAVNNLTFSPWQSNPWIVMRKVAGAFIEVNELAEQFHAVPAKTSPIESAPLKTIDISLMELKTRERKQQDIALSRWESEGGKTATSASAPFSQVIELKKRRR